MVADALTKMGTVTMLSNLRSAMLGDLPPVPGEDRRVRPEDKTWWAAAVLHMEVSKDNKGHG